MTSAPRAQTNSAIRTRRIKLDPEQGDVDATIIIYVTDASAYRLFHLSQDLDGLTNRKGLYSCCHTLERVWEDLDAEAWCRENPE